MILIFSGTKDGREIVNKILNIGYSVIVSTATKYGSNLISDHPSLNKIYGELNFSAIKELIVREQVSTVIDATHPYAVEISKNILLATKEARVRNIRYERTSVKDESIILLDSFTEIAEYLNKRSGMILLTIGANNLQLIVDKINNRSRIIARVLPVISSLNKAKNAGLKPAQIIAMQGPFSIELNEALIKSYGVKYLITKDSGSEGGLLEKINAAKNNNVEVIMLTRPKLNYKLVVNTIDDLLSMLCLS